jgi:hypothetical protein
MGGMILFLIVGVLIFVLWGMVEVRHVKHKLYTLLIIGLLLFAVVSGTMVFKGKNIDYTSPAGIFEAEKIYFSFLGLAGKNVFTLTSNAVKLDWNPDLATPTNSTK